MSITTPGPFDPRSPRRRHGGQEQALRPSGAGGPRLGPQTEGGATESEILGFGMKLFLASLTMVFMGCFVAYVVMWAKNRDGWQSAVDTAEVITLAAATVLLVAADLAAARALKRAPDRAAARRLTVVTIVLALVYLVVQATSWMPIFRRVDRTTGGDLRMEEVVFLILTLAHAIHVLGGIIANGVVVLRAEATGGPRRDTLRLLYQYWRFLTVVWVGVLALLFAF